MTRFDHLDRLASRTIDRFNAEPVRLEPMVARPNGRHLVDHMRERIEGRGIFSQRSTPNGIQIGSRRAGSETNDLRALVSGQAIELSIDRASNPAFIAKQGDHIAMPDRGRRFTVVTVRPDGAARIVINLQEIL